MMVLFCWFYALVMTFLGGSSSILMLLFSLELLSWSFVLVIPLTLSFGYLVIQSYFLLLGLLGLHWSSLVLILSVLLKMGMPPIHQWLLKISAALNINVFLFLMTLHKLLPVLFLSKLMLMSELWAILVILVFTSMMVSNSSSVMPTLIFSSFVHSAWMAISGILSMGFLLFYWSLYSILSGLLLSSLALKSAGELFLGQSSFSSMTWLVLSGLPPFLVFWLKLNLMVFFLDSISVLMGWLAVGSSVLVLSAYFRTWYLNEFLLSLVSWGWGVAPLVTISLMGFFY